MNRYIAAFVLVVGGIPTAAQSCSKQELELGVFGVAWSDSGDEVQRKLPSSQSPRGASARLVMVRGDHEFCGLQIKAFTLRLSEHARSIESADFVVGAADYTTLAKKLERSFGQPRAVTVNGGQTFSHVVEWSGPLVSLRMQSVTHDRMITSAAAMDVVVHLQPGPIIESEVSRIESELTRHGRVTD